MKIGWSLPSVGKMGTRDNITALAREAELLAYDSVWTAERLLYPTHPRQNQPGTKSWPIVYQQSLDTLGTLLFAAAVTDTVRLGTSTLDFPYHNPAQLAKAIATLDVLSNGRAVIGAGQGWSEDEYIASGVPFEERTGRFVETIHVLNALWAPDPVEFHGKYFEVPATLFNPKPIQQPRPPIVVGAMAPAAIARAARLADGFNPLASPTAEATEATLGQLFDAWQEAGRFPTRPEIILRINNAELTVQPLDDPRPFLSGSVEQVRDDVMRLGEWGVTEIIYSNLGVGYGKPDGLNQQLAYMTRLRGVA